MRRRPTHAVARKRHVRRRAVERAGIEVGRRTCDMMVETIKEGKSTFVKRKSRRASVHDVELPGGSIIRVVYCDGEIVTVLDRGKLKQ